MSLSQIVRCAHRGASVECPENTLLAFRRALEIGVDALELDVRLTADDHLVVIHDSQLDRTTNGKGRVRDHSLAEIQQLNAGQGQRIPTLLEVMNLVKPTDVRLCVEIKGDTPVEEQAITKAVVSTLESNDFVKRTIVTSFSPATLRRVRAQQPAQATMLDPLPQDGTLTPRQICEQALRAGANCLSYKFAHITPAVAAECRLTGLALWPWSPNDPDPLRAMIQLGVPAIITDRPDILNKVLHDSTF